MDGPGALREKLVALFALGLLLFSPPLLLLFNSPNEYLGFPILYLYLFGIWAMLVALVATMAHSRKRVPGRGGPQPRKSGV